jgi:acyl carrier protein
MDDVEKRFKRIVADIFKVDASKLKGSTRFVEDLGVRSLTMISLVAAVENEFGITTSPQETSKNKTIAQSVAYIEKLVKQKK